MNKKLVVYFSRTGENYCNGTLGFLQVGNTSVLAKIIASELKEDETDLFELKPAVLYSNSYDACNERAREEDSTGAFPTLVGSVDISGYEDIYIGFPLWYRTFPRVIATFIEANKGKWFGKKVHPFCTNEEGYTGTMELELSSCLKGAIVSPALSVRGFEVNLEKTKQEVKEWLK